MTRLADFALRQYVLLQLLLNPAHVLRSGDFMDRAFPRAAVVDRAYATRLLTHMPHAD